MEKHKEYTVEEQVEEQVEKQVEEQVELKKLRTILIVDDITYLIDNLKSYFDLMEYDVNISGCTNGNDAIELVKNTSFDIILMDIKMLPINGYDTARGIRKNGYDGLIIGLTGMVSEQSKKEIYASGMNGVIYKPYTFEALIENFKKYGFYLELKSQTEIE